ncbi:flagellar biosynthesis protein FlgF (plasmid) [Phyllobacterium zundukense]|uniref:DUF1217 domain-containing protein n=1 Tax=Phyllobacterium zundukense TaxID=1867719 RepID=UPI000C1BE9B9|nr:DUF1217 domain-containing protein [Phyllobacterium zundukense]ATU95901.1 flagellar biosynthesis protein FlgF [Phyllobacterium zundukense]
MINTMTSYRLIAADLPRSLARVAKEPVVQRDSDYYLKNIGNVKTIDDFMKDTKLYNYALKAFGLDNMAYAKAFIRKVLTEGVTDKNSFANKLTDTRYKEFAAAFDFAKLGDKATSQPGVLQPVVDKYVRQTLEVETGQQNDGVRLALYFARKAPTITSAYQILGDKALLEVFQTTFSIPAATSNMDIDRQAKMVEEKLNLADLKDPKKLDKLMTRFTAMYELKNPSTATSIPSMLIGGSTTIGIADSILTTLQSFKLGGR